MSKPKYTPGPWRGDGQTANDITNWYIRPTQCHVEEYRNGPIAHMLRFNPWPIPKDEIEANLNLIAAAPEMLEALEWCVETFDGLAAVYPSLDNERGFARAKAVIKKAKGE